MIQAQSSPAAANEPSRIRVYVGTYTKSDDQGINAFELQLDNGAVTEPKVVAKLPNPTFLAWGPEHRQLYAVSEVRQVERGEVKRTGGAVYGFAVDGQTGALKEINWQSSEGAGPCHLCVDPQGANVLVANYGGGSIACLPRSPEGKLAAATTFVQHTGSSVLPDRQSAPHAHSINVSEDNRFAIVADLGLDQLLVYRLDAKKGLLTPNDPPFVKTAPGAGPRHFCFHPNGQLAFHNNETNSTVTSYRYDAQSGVLTPITTLSTLPDGYDGKNYTAECITDAAGRFVYVSNRGHDSIAAFRIATDGTLTAAGHAPSGGKIPRNFNIDPTGNYMLVANQDSDNVVIQKLDPETGLPTATGVELTISRPVCLKMIALP